MTTHYRICVLLVLALGILGNVSTHPTLSKASPGRKRTLVLIDNASFYLTHSQLLRQLAEMDHTVQVELVSTRSVTDGSVRLEEDKELLYDNLIFMATSLAELPETKDFNLPRFFQKGGNVFFMIDNDISPFFREYVKKFGFGVDKSGSYLVDYDRALDPSQPNVFQVSNFKDIDLLAEGVKGPLVYNGQGLETTIFENTQITVFARGGIHTGSVVYGGKGGRYSSNNGKNNILLLGIQVVS